MVPDSLTPFGFRLAGIRLVLLAGPVWCSGLLEIISKPLGGTEAMQSAIPEQAAGQLHQSQVVKVMLVVTYQDRSAFRQPGQRPLHYPAPRLVPPLAGPGRCLFFADATDVPGVARRRDRRVTGRIIVRLVQAQMLRTLGCRLRPLDDDGLDGGPEQLRVVAVGTLDHQPQGPALLVNQYTAFGAVFAAVRGIFAHLFSPRTGPCSWPRRRSASPSKRRQVRR